MSSVMMLPSIELWKVQSLLHRPFMVIVAILSREILPQILFRENSWRGYAIRVHKNHGGDESHKFGSGLSSPQFA